MGERDSSKLQLALVPAEDEDEIRELFVPDDDYSYTHKVRIVRCNRDGSPVSKRERTTQDALALAQAWKKMQKQEERKEKQKIDPIIIWTKLVANDEVDVVAGLIKEESEILPYWREVGLTNASTDMLGLLSKLT